MGNVLTSVINVYNFFGTESYLKAIPLLYGGTSSLATWDKSEILEQPPSAMLTFGFGSIIGGFLTQMCFDFLPENVKTPFSILLTASSLYNVYKICKTKPKPIVNSNRGLVQLNINVNDGNKYIHNSLQSDVEH